MASGAGVNSSGKSLYEVLGVNKADTTTDIKKAYLKLARIHHPDKGGDPERFKEIQRASEILTDDNRRRMYDEFGVTGDEPGGGGMPPGGMPGGFQFPFEVNLNDLFGNMFGSPPVGVQRGPIRKGKKPAASIQTINATLEQFYLGNTFNIAVNRNIFCKECDHSGAKSRETCKKCGGKGAVSQVVQMGPMAMHTTGPCLDCKGRGERILEQCVPCTGTGFTTEKRTLTVRLTPGTRPSETFVFPEVCSDHPAFERPGDAHIIVTEDPSDPAFKYFKRTGDKLENLETRVSLSLSESLIGCVVRIDGHPGYDDGLFIKIPAGSFHGDRYCLSSMGMPIMGDIGRYGDLFIVIDVSIAPNERKLFTTRGSELLVPLFEDKIRTVDAPAGAVQEGAYLTK
jgi:DnaJ family protein A protein 2